MVELSSSCDCMPLSLSIRFLETMRTVAAYTVKVFLILPIGISSVDFVLHPIMRTQQSTVFTFRFHYAYENQQSPHKCVLKLLPRMQKNNRIFTDVSQTYEHALYNDINGFSQYRCIFEDFLLTSLYQQNLCISHALFFTTKSQDRISYHFHTSCCIIPLSNQCCLQHNPHQDLCKCFFSFFKCITNA